MTYVIIILIAIVIISLFRAYNRQNGYFEVLDQHNQTKSFGSYSQCQQWIQAQKGMEQLGGVRNTYRIRKKKF